MKAIVHDRYGPPSVLQLREIAKPSPGKGEVLVRVRASTVTAGDCELRRFDIPWWIWLPVRAFMGWLRPKVNVLGQELSGVVEELGENVTQFKAGDEIVAVAGMKMGGYAEYKCLSENATLCLKPGNMSFEEAATLPTGGLNSIFFLKKGKIQTGSEVLVIGAGGSIGTYGIQIAKAWGATVTAVDRADKHEALKEAGADMVIDYQRENFWEGNQRYDTILDVIGKYSMSKGLSVLKQNGVYLLANPGVRKMFRSLAVNAFTSKKVVFSLADEQRSDLETLVKMAEEGKLKAIIDRSYSLEEMQQAHEYVERDEKKGNVTIRV